TPVQRGLQEKDAGKKADKKGKGKKGGEIQQFPVRLERLRRQLEYARPALLLLRRRSCTLRIIWNI
ncbi:MAG TPA: hypothetical protein VKV15_11260, partial [Bryobacteraceae bacterium]|nr:hypothetical protein [Bryobacteraceae bacterium]